jgi:hypothetical protein
MSVICIRKAPVSNTGRGTCFFFFLWFPYAFLRQMSAQYHLLSHPFQLITHQHVFTRGNRPAYSSSSQKHSQSRSTHSTAVCRESFVLSNNVQMEVADLSVVYTLCRASRNLCVKLLLSALKVKKVKLSLLQAKEVHRVARSQGSHIT